jgi:uncharacterized membrane protein (DUF373 family)
MSNITTSDHESKHGHDNPSHHQSPVSHKNHDLVATFSGRLLERGDSIIYAIVGICFFLGAIFALGYSFWDFGSSLLQAQGNQAVVANAIIKLVSDLLLVLIIMEVLGTVIHYLKAHATSLRPFLFIGIISATRGVLSIGARLSIETVTGDEFYRAMIELGANALAILALGITLKLLGRIADES